MDQYLGSAGTPEDYCSKIGFRLPVWQDRSQLELNCYVFTCDHGDIAKFVESVEAQNSLKIDASVANPYLVEIFKSFLYS